MAVYLAPGDFDASTTCEDEMKKRETFKDRNSRVLGYIETLSDGSQQAMDPSFTIIGHYDRRKDVTQDVHFQTLSKGNTLIKLVDPNSLAEM